MNRAPAKVLRVIDYVERKLGDFYGFAPLAQGARHLVSKAELKASFGDVVTTLPEYQARAGVFLQEPRGGDDLYIGIHFEDQVLADLDRKDPLQRLDDQNLDAFCVLIEELSHFHLILNRMDRGQGVSKLELEWQGEVDKLLVSAVTLEGQAGDLHLSPLAMKLFDQAHIVGEDQELYRQATRHAARFWFAAAASLGEKNGGLTPNLRAILRQSYHAPWAEKSAHLGKVA